MQSPLNTEPARPLSPAGRLCFDLRERNDYSRRVAQVLRAQRERHIEQVIRAQRRNRVHQGR
jgi:hypothetical protein